MKPMLAHKFKLSKAQFPCYAQPKVNGVRGLWIGDKMQSRGRPKETGKEWHRPVIGHIFSDMEIIQNELGFRVPGDGELYKHGLSLQQINSRVAVNRTTPHKDVGDIKYCLFDIIMNASFQQRLLVMQKIDAVVKKYSLSNVYVIETQEINDYAEFELYHKLNRQRGFEGTMYREAGVGYGFPHQCTNQENRWNRLMKRKDWLDLNCEIVEVIEGREGKTGQMLNKAGALKLRTPDGVEFNAGSGLIMRHRSFLWKIRKEIVGTTARIKFPEYSDNGTPVQPVVEMINDERFEG